MALHRPSRRTINRLRAKNCKIRGKSRLIEDHSGKDGLTATCPLKLLPVAHSGPGEGRYDVS